MRQQWVDVNLRFIEEEWGTGRLLESLVPSAERDNHVLKGVPGEWRLFAAA